MTPSIKYSESLEKAFAKYHTGDEKDNNEKTQYDLYTKVLHATQFFEFSRRYFDLGGKSFLEVGCGTGAVSVAAALMGAKVSATEVVDAALDLTRMRWLEHDLEAELSHWDIRSEAPQERRSKFDVVYCYQVIEHIPRDWQFTALRNLFSVVAPSGYLFIDTENSLCPFDRHDSKTWLVRLLSKSAYEPILTKLGRSLDFFEPTAKARVRTRDYLSYDELIGAAQVSGFDVVDPFMPHGGKRRALQSLTGSDWLYDSIAKHFDVERFMPISLLLRRR